MGISLVVGRDSPEECVQPSYDLVQQLISRFTSQHGSTQCPQLIECDLGSEEGQRAFIENNWIVRCQHCVKMPQALGSPCWLKYVDINNTKPKSRVQRPADVGNPVI